MSRAVIGKIEKDQYDFGGILLLMLICLLSLIAGNVMFHAGTFPATDVASQYLSRHFSFDMQDYSTVADFLWAVIIASRGDILCVLLIAISRLVKAQKLFVSVVFAYRSFVFGFCGAYIIGMIGLFGSFLHGCVSWVLFFIYHIFYFAVLICFGSATLAADVQIRLGRRLHYIITVCGEIALVILLNVIYYFLISKI